MESTRRCLDLSSTAANKQSQRKNAFLAEANLSTAGEKAAHWVLVKLRSNRRKSLGTEWLGEEKPGH
jgi:hypothetical protein